MLGDVLGVVTRSWTRNPVWFGVGRERWGTLRGEIGGWKRAWGWEMAYSVFEMAAPSCGVVGGGKAPALTGLVGPGWFAVIAEGACHARGVDTVRTVGEGGVGLAAPSVLRRASALACGRCGVAHDAAAWSGALGDASHEHVGGAGLRTRGDRLDNGSASTFFAG